MSKSDEFALSSGLPWADTVVTITAAEFGYNPNIGGGTVVCANLTATNEDGDESEQSFSVGEGWEIVDNGKRIQADNGSETKKISKNSNYGRLIASAVQAVGDPEDMPFDSAKQIEGWIGTQWQTGSVVVKVRNPQTGAEKERDAIIFTGFVGAGDGGQTTKVGPRVKAAPAKASAPAEDDPLVQQLLEIAKEAEDFDAFTEKALDLPGVEDNAKLVSRVMSAKADGIWKTAGR